MKTRKQRNQPKRTPRRKQALSFAPAESKIINRSLSTYFPSISTTWSELDITNIGQGTTVQTRIGSQVHITTIRITGVIAQGSSQTALDDPYNVVRIVVGLYTAGGLPSTPLLTAGATLNSPICSQSNTNGRLVRKFLDVYVPLHVVCVERDGGDGYVPSLKKFDYSVRVSFRQTYGTDAATYPNHTVILSMISDSSAVPGPGFVAGRVETRFTDV